MKSRIWPLLLGVPLLATTACALDPDPLWDTSSRTAVSVSTPSPKDIEDVIVLREREWVAAIVKRDIATLDRLLADDFVGTSPTAHTYYKTVALRDLESGAYAVKSMDLDEVTANVYGDVAVAFTSQEEVSTYAGEDASGHYHYTNVWLKQNGEWRVVASHGSRYDRRH